MSKKLFLLIDFVLLAVILINCAKENTTQPENSSQLTYQDVFEKVLQPQETYLNKYQNLLSLIDSSSALDSVVKLFRSNVNVQWAERTIDGINVQYKNGIRGGIILGNLNQNKSSSIDVVHKSVEKKSIVSKQLTNITPLSKKTIILSLFGLEIEPLDEAFYQWLPSIGFEEPTFFLYWRYPEDIDKFKNLSDYGIIYINSGGYPWPDINNVQESYLTTKIVFNKEIFEKYFTDFMVGNLIVKTNLLFGNVVLIGSNFIHSYNNFELNKPLIIGAFGFSHFSELAKKIGLGNKGAFVGYDWTVPNEFSIDWTNQLIYDLTNEPMNLRQWMIGPYPKSKTYWGRTVNINFTGPDYFGLYNGPNWPWRIVNVNLYNVDAILDVSTGGTYQWNNLGFGHPYQYTKISSDGKTFTAMWDSTYEDGNLNRGELSITVDTLNYLVESFTASYYYENRYNGIVYDKQSMEIQGHNIPMVYKDDNTLVNEVQSVNTCNYINHFTFNYVQNPGTQNEISETLTSYSCNTNSSIRISWYKNRY